jgi:hypothetical protein
MPCPRYRRRVWCETVPPDTLAAPATVALLQRFAVDPILAVWPATVRAAREAAARFAGAGLRPALWPMLPDADGRWIGAGNAALFCAFAEALAREGGSTEMILDLEPPIESVRTTLASRAVDAHLLPVPAGTAAFRDARARITGLVARLHAHGATVSAAVVPPVLLDRPGGLPGWQARLGTPVDGIAWDHVSPMLYTSMLEGWSRGLLARRDARALLAWGCQASVQRFGSIAGASLGAVGTGAFGDEPTYRSPAELADDVVVARGAGVDDLALFDLGGVLRRPPAEAWLDAFTAVDAGAPLPEPVLSGRAWGVVAAMRVAGAAFGLGLSAALRLRSSL